MRNVINHRQVFDDAALGGGVEHEIHRSYLVGRLRPGQRLPLGDRHLLSLALPHLQFCFLIQPLHALEVHGFSRLPPFQVDLPYAIALGSLRQCHDALPKIHVVL